MAAKKAVPSFTPSGTVVAVRWLDAWYSDFENDSNTALALEVVGHVLIHNAEGLKLAMEICPSGSAGARQIKFIPAAMIARIEILRK